MNLRKMTILILILAAALIPAAVSHAAMSTGTGAPEFWISPDGKLTPDAISYTRDRNGPYYLMLPASVDPGKMVIGVAGNTQLTINGRAVHNGDSAEILREGDLSVKAGMKTFTLHVMTGSPGIPVLYITTETGDLQKIESSKEYREPGKMVFVGPDGAVQYDGDLEHIKLRGNYSKRFPKKCYQIKLKTGTSLMGMGKAKKWILTSNYRDESLLRNQIMFDMAEAVGLPYTTAHCQAEVYINHQYRGLYLFSEKIEIEDDRVDIADLEKATAAVNTEPLSSYDAIGKQMSVRNNYKAFDIPNNPEDISGGYLLESEIYASRYQSENCAYTTSRGLVLVLKEPEYASLEQMTYITGIMQSFEDAINAENGCDPATGKHYTEIADEESMTLKYMVEELSENYDGNSSSLYFFKPADAVSEKIFLGPVWDYDSSFGTHAARWNAKFVLDPESLWIAETDREVGWFPALWRHKEFRQKVASLWNDRMKACVEVLLGTRSAGSVPGAENLKSIDEYAAEIEASAAMDAARWPKSAKVTVTEAYTGYTFEGSVKFLKEYLQKRAAFLDETWNAAAK